MSDEREWTLATTDAGEGYGGHWYWHVRGCDVPASPIDLRITVVPKSRLEEAEREYRQLATHAEQMDQEREQAEAALQGLRASLTYIEQECGGRAGQIARATLDDPALTAARQVQ